MYNHHEVFVTFIIYLPVKVIIKIVTDITYYDNSAGEISYILILDDCLQSAVITLALKRTNATFE